MVTENEQERKVVILDEELHRQAKIEAARRGVTLKQLVAQLLKKELQPQE